MKNASSSSPTENLLIEEREEVMVTKKGRCLRKTHFLKPFLTSIKGGSVAELPRRHYQRPSDFSSDLKRFSSQVSFSGFWFAERRFLSWVVKMEALHAHTWKKAGIFDAIKASTYKISKNTSLILSVTEKWCPETKSFVFPWGEATITLEDVMVLLGFSVLGSPIFAPLKSSEMRDAVEKLDKARFESRCRDSYVSVKSWISSFSGSGGQMEHEAFLVLWLSLFVFPSTARRSVSKYVTSIAVRLARGERIALAPVVLSILYRDLGRICDFSRDKSDDKIYIKSLFKLVQVWIWERFRNTRPKAREIPKGEPRIAQWGGLPQRSKTRLRFDDFEWRPYTKPLKNWNPLRFYLEEAMWVTVDDSVDDDEFVSFARCVTVSQLVGDGFLEDYFPNRVAMQFGLAQDLPALVTRRRNFTEKEAWNDYSKSLDGLKLYMPCRLDRGSVTARYRVWWLKSVAKFLGSAEMQKETTETFNARKKSDDGDDASPKVLPLSHVVQKLEEGFSAKRRRSRMHRLVKQDKIGVLPVQLKRANEDEEDDNITIARWIESRKKYSSDAEIIVGDASETLGKRTRRYLAADSDDGSEPCKKYASTRVEQRREKDDETANKSQKTREILNGFDADVIGNNEGKKNMIDGEQHNGLILQSIGRDGSKKAECLVHEDGEKQRCNDEKLCSEVKKEEELDERLKQRRLAVKEIELKLEARMVKVKKTLAKIIVWKTRGNTNHNI
ncbi:PREDICTED: uncharacterized protein LOC104758384 isoform X3 [Camelina sativa]|uniref:Uncharacterized protein LOC104758384 isoform X3 n=1 Tax=Camelina sativa TaxID=90675 RepID=A0ABM0X2A8_CAMSA|nr:PREDICTED: uncharacterized protein LOC104758384 isoform X3 [Camelina sativa]